MKSRASSRIVLPSVGAGELVLEGTAEGEEREHCDQNRRL